MDVVQQSGVPMDSPPAAASDKFENGPMHQIEVDVAVSEDGVTIFPQPVVGDKLDPLNWSFVQKHTILVIISSLVFMLTWITTTTVPSFPNLQAKYNISESEVNWTVAIPALGVAFGPLLWASPSDMIGRRSILNIATIVAFGATIGAALAPNYGGYMAARFFQGVGISPGYYVGLAAICDVFFDHERGQKIGIWVLAIDLGLLIGPLIGGFVNRAGDAWIQWLTAIILGIILLSQLLFLPETLYPREMMLRQTSTILPFSESSDDKRRNPNSAHAQPQIVRTKDLPFINVVFLPGIQHPNFYETPVRFLKTFQLLVVAISVLTYCFGWYSWMISVVTLIPVAYETFSSESQGLLYIGLIIGTLVSEVFFSGRLSDWLVIQLARRNNNVKSPEMRLWLAYPAILLTAVGLVIWGISIDRDYHWIVGQVAFALLGAGIQMGNTAVCSYIVDAYPKQSMAVMTFFAVMINLASFADPFFIIPWVNGVGFTWTFAGHALITAFFCAPVMILLQRYGELLREKTGKPSWVNPEFNTDIGATIK